MPHVDHVDLGTQFLLQGYYVVGKSKSTTSYVVSRLSKDGNHLYFDYNPNFKLTAWSEINPT